MRKKTLLESLLQDDQGATAIEYGLILALVAIAMITALQGVAAATIDMWGDVETKVSDATTAVQS